MTAIERTAYPRFKSQTTKKELAELYTPSTSELVFAQGQVKGKRGLLRFLVMLKSFQRLGYFPLSETVPPNVIGHIRTCLNLSSSVCAIPSDRSRYYYAEAIRDYLKVTTFDRKAQTIIATAIAQAAEVMEHPADLINVGIEELVRERYELPAFSTLDRLVGHVRTVVNNRLFQRIVNAMTPTQQDFVDGLVSMESELTFTILRSPPKSARLSHVQELQAKFEQMIAYGDARLLIATIAPAKVKSFAAQAKALALTDLQEIQLTKLRQRLPERSVLDILCRVEHWLNWVRHFGLNSGSEPKIENSVERYILTVFGYGCNLGPNETARNTRGQVSSRMLAYIK
jgi:Domain of unknown function (DUF4158)/Tn3 transposase DDE domain